MELDILTLYDRLSNRWERRSGLFLSIVFLLGLYFIIMRFFGLGRVPHWKWMYFFLPMLLIVVLFLFWVWNTNRFFFRFTNKITAGISLIIDNDRDRLIISKILKRVVDKINNNDDLSEFRLKVLPANILIHDKKVKRYQRNFNFMYDLVIRIFIDSGNYDAIEKIIVRKLSVTFRPKSTSTHKKLFYSTIDLIKDMDLQFRSRDWEYSHKNDGIDKIKYLGNIYHILLYYLGFYSIYTDKYAEALAAMLSIFDLKKTILNLTTTDSGKKTFRLTPYNIAEGRLSAILIDLFFHTASESYKENDVKKALLNFVKLENLIKRHPGNFDQFITMARYSYELGDLRKAKEYNNKAKTLKPRSLEIFLNLGFFAILDDSTVEFCSNYRSIFENRTIKHRFNWLDVLEFLEKQRKRFPQRQTYFDFSTSFIEFVFIGSISQTQYMDKISQFPNDPKFECIKELALKVLQPSTKKTAKKKNKTKRKHKKRNR